MPSVVSSDIYFSCLIALNPQVFYRNDPRIYFFLDNHKNAIQLEGVFIIVLDLPYRDVIMVMITVTRIMTIMKSYLLSRVLVTIDGFWIACLDLLTPYSHHSGLQAIQHSR
jgi:hypothetical protein